MSTPLRHLLHAVLFDQETRTQLDADPEAFLASHGWEHLAGPELAEAVAALGDALPVETARAIADSCETIDFAGGSLIDVGADLAALADQIDPELPVSFPADGPDVELDLDFGGGADPHSDSDSAPGVDAQDAVDAVLGTDGAEVLRSDEWPTDDLDVDVDVELGEPAFDAGASFLPDVDHTDSVDLDGPDEPDIDVEG